MGPLVSLELLMAEGSINATLAVWEASLRTMQYRKSARSLRVHVFLGFVVERSRPVVYARSCRKTEWADGRS
jgi:hypothetical protein